MVQYCGTNNLASFNHQYYWLSHYSQIIFLPIPVICELELYRYISNTRNRADF